MSLQAKLDAIKAQFESGGPPLNVPKSVIETLHRATAELVASGAAGRALKAGDRAPAFVLADPNGVVVSSADLLAKGPLVLSFYRGAWCPYCNTELQALQEALASLREAGAELVAISPQTPANSRKAVAEHKLGFPVLSDPSNAVANSYGVRYRAPEYLIDLFKTLKVDLPSFNGDDSWTLPMPARFVIGPDAIIRYAEVNPDYTRRPEPEDMLPAIRGRVTKAA